MTVRYTAVAGMAETAPRDFDRERDQARDVNHWRDKVELRLDNRQVFFLFFGSAVVACMLFVLGVMVGKRIESRGQAEAPELQDPLAALDRARQPPPGVAAPEAQLTFPNTLIGGAGAAKGTKVASRPAKPVAPVAAPKPVVVVVAAPKPVAPAAAPKPVAPAVAPKPVAVAAAPKPVAVAAAPKPVVVAVAPKPLAVAAAPKPVAPAAIPKPVAAAADAPKGKGKFTLHLSTFATADDASAFADKYPGAFVVAGEVPGKGTAYRVRYGNFASFKDATAAKETFEKQHNLIALVAAR